MSIYYFLGLLTLPLEISPISTPAAMGGGAPVWVGMTCKNNEKSTEINVKSTILGIDEFISNNYDIIEVQYQLFSSLRLRG